jgi:glycyl-tRNA synthetase beta chain
MDRADGEEGGMSMATENLLVELLVEELPPKALKKLGLAFAGVLADSLKAQGLAAADAVVTDFASPRRLAVHVTRVAYKSDEKSSLIKLMPEKVAYSAEGQHTAALKKRLSKEGYFFDDGVLNLVKELDDKGVMCVWLKKVDQRVTLEVALQHALAVAIAKLPIPKVMSYPLWQNTDFPGWDPKHFVRPVHGLIALHGGTVIPLREPVLGLRPGNTTQGHRFEASVSPVVIAHADDYEKTLADDGAVIASFDKRRADIERQLQAAAANLGAQPVDDDALLDEVTGLVERPKVMVCSFDAEFLEVPQECLILTMKANQKYFPLLDAAGKLSNRFLIVSNINPADTSAVVGGNERVVRPRLADAQFFYNQDRKRTLESRVEGLFKVVYHNRLGTQGDRMQRVCQIANAIGLKLGGPSLAEKAVVAARLAKTDLLTDMVGEFPELQGVMGGYYANNDGLSIEVAEAIEDHYKPRFAGDDLPRNKLGVVVALADKLETLVGLFLIGNVPTGDKDPFALRRHAFGVMRMLVENEMNLPLSELIFDAYRVLDDWVDVNHLSGEFLHEDDLVEDLSSMMMDRLAGSLREQGFSAQEVDAVLALRPQRLGEVPKRLAAVRAFAALPESPALAAANKRIANILKKADDVDAHVSPVLLQEDAEKALHAAMQTVLPKAQSLFEAGDYTASLQALAVLRAPVDAFFDGVMVNAEQIDVRLNRLGLLKTLHLAMNRVADLSKLAA